MKHVRRLAGEPAALAAYRARRASDADAAAAQAAAVWKRFRRTPAYRRVRDELARRQQGLCVYCEERLVRDDGELVPNHYEVEHVLAKSKGVGRTLDWTNLALACRAGADPKHTEESSGSPKDDSSSCGRYKDGQELPPGCDPRAFPVSPRVVTVSLDGRIEPDAEGCRAAGVQVEDLRRAIEGVLNLNCERLRVARQHVGDHVRVLFVPLMDSMEELLVRSQIGRARLRRELELGVAERLQPDAGGHLTRFWTTELSAIGEPADRWVAENSSLFT